MYVHTHIYIYTYKYRYIYIHINTHIYRHIYIHKSLRYLTRIDSSYTPHTKCHDYIYDLHSLCIHDPCIAPLLFVFPDFFFIDYAYTTQAESSNLFPRITPAAKAHGRRQ